MLDRDQIVIRVTAAAGAEDPGAGREQIEVAVAQMLERRQRTLAVARGVRSWP
jgi:hypothetical protein